MNVRKFLVLLFSITIFSACSNEEETPFVFQTTPAKVFKFSAHQAASRVIGQNDFVSNQPSTSQSRLTSPQGVDMDGHGALRIADTGNNRIIGYNSIPTFFITNADFVLGQASFVDSSAQAPQANNFKAARGIRSSSDGKYIVADTGNNRVLIFNTAPTSSSQDADVVIGAADFQTAGTGGCTAAELNAPSDVFMISGKLFISDTGNNRVLIYNSIPTSNMAAASLVVGQPNATTCAAGTADNKLSAPAGVWSDGSKLLVADQSNNRVLIWSLLPATDGQSANVVLGQPDFTSSAANNGGVSSTSLNSPSSVAFSSFGQVFVSDMGNNRILIWDSFPTYNHVPAYQVLGQSNMTDSTAANPPLSSSLSSARNILINYGSVIVADTGNNRILIFNTH
jgi:hypothetical protein